MKGYFMYRNLLNIKFFAVTIFSMFVIIGCSQISYSAEQYYKLVSYKPLTKSQCLRYKKRLGLKQCNFHKDYLAGAAYACGHVRNMPSADDLHQLAKKIYHTETTATSIYGSRDDAQLKRMGIFVNNTHIFYWTNGEADDGVNGYVRMFAKDGSIPYPARRNAQGVDSQALGLMKFSNYHALCKTSSKNLDNNTVEQNKKQFQTVLSF